MVFSYGCGRQRNRGLQKNAGKLQAVLMTMVMRWYDEVHIAQWSTSRVSLNVTVCCHWTPVPYGSSDCHERQNRFKKKNTNKKQFLVS